MTRSRRPWSSRDLPASATEKSKTLMAAFGLVKHKPGGLKIKKAKKTAKKAVKKPAKKKAKRG